MLTTATLYCLFSLLNPTSNTNIYTLSLHDALPICLELTEVNMQMLEQEYREALQKALEGRFSEELRALYQMPVREQVDRKSTRLNSSHLVISYAVFCLKKKIYYCN